MNYKIQLYNLEELGEKKSLNYLNDRLKKRNL